MWIFLACGHTSRTNVEVPDVTKEFDTILIANSNKSYPTTHTHQRKLVLSGEVDGRFRIQYKEVPRDSSEKVGLFTREYNGLSGSIEQEGEWYDNKIFIRYIPVDSVVDGHLNIEFIGYAFK